MIFSVECPGFTVDDSTQGSWAASPEGTVATIECSNGYILVGNDTLTCKNDSTWSSDAPECDEMGKHVS